MSNILEEGRAEYQLSLKDRALAASAEGITIADATKPDYPLIYVNRGFEELTGYSAQSVGGRNCRFLQGEATDPAAAEEIRRAIKEKRGCVVEILNYRKNGEPFWNRLSFGAATAISSSTLWTSVNLNSLINAVNAGLIPHSMAWPRAPVGPRTPFAGY